MIAVVYLFLQGWRATLIPLLAVPVSLVGTFLFFPLFGFTINTLSLFGLVLAIGLVVDDAIVVVEAVERHIEEGLVSQGSGAQSDGGDFGPGRRDRAGSFRGVRADGVHTGHYRQALSAIRGHHRDLRDSLGVQRAVAQPRAGGAAAEAEGGERGLLARFFGWFNRMFGRATNGYVRVSGALLRKSAVALVLLAGFGVAGFWIGGKLPTSFVPDEDQGYFYLNVQLPNAASLQRTEAVVAKIKKILAKTPGVEYSTSVTGFSLLSLVRTSYNAFVFVSMKDWGNRKSKAEQFQAIKAHLNAGIRASFRKRVAFGFSPPAIPGVGTSGGFTFILEDRAGKDVQFLRDNLNKFMAAARKRPEIGSLSTTFLPSVPQQFVEVDRDKVIKQGVAINDVYRTIQTFMGGLFVNYFNRFGRQWQVYVEAEGDYRTKSENVGQFYVRNAAGEMVPLSALTKFESANRPGVHHALQRIPVGAVERRRGARLQQRPGDEGARGNLRGKPCRPKWATTIPACRSRRRRRRKAYRRR